MKNCAFTPKFPITSNKLSHKCKKCPLRTESRAEFLFHETLHRGPASTAKDAKKNKYKCPLCVKLFRRASLRCHLRLHTSERPYVCDKCKMGFVRKSNLVDHLKNMHIQNAEEGNNSVDGSTLQQNSGNGEVKKFLCATCGANFSKR